MELWACYFMTMLAIVLIGVLVWLVWSFYLNGEKTWALAVACIILLILWAIPAFITAST